MEAAKAARAELAMSGETSIGSYVDGQFEVHSGPHAYRGKEGCLNVTCTRSSLETDRCFGWHCCHCDGPTSYQGHVDAGRYVDGEFRRFADGEIRLSCQPGYLEAALEPVQADAGPSTATSSGGAKRSPYPKTDGGPCMSTEEKRPDEIS